MTSVPSRRESNLELARVLAMSAIMLHHFCFMLSGCKR